MAYKVYFADNLNDGAVGLQVDNPYPGRGFISEDATALSIGAYAGQDFDWWWNGVGRRGILGYKTIPYNPYKYAKWYFECTVYSCGGTANSGTYPCNLIYDTTHMYYTWVGSGGSTSVSVGIWNGSDVGIGSFTATFPQRMRWTWDIVTNKVQFQYWNGSTWTNVGSEQTPPWTMSQFGFGVKNWSGTPAVTSKWSGFVMSYDESAGGQILADGKREQNAGIIDSLAFPSRTGDLAHSWPRVGKGLVLP